MTVEAVRRRVERLENGAAGGVGLLVYIYDPAWNKEERRERAPPTAIIWLPNNVRDQPACRCGGSPSVTGKSEIAPTMSRVTSIRSSTQTLMSFHPPSLKY